MKSVIPKLFPHYKFEWDKNRVHSHLWNIQYWLVYESILGDDVQPHDKFNMLFRGARFIETDIIKNYV